MVFLNLLKQMPGHNLKLGHAIFYSISFSMQYALIFPQVNAF